MEGGKGERGKGEGGKGEGGRAKGEEGREKRKGKGNEEGRLSRRGRHWSSVPEYRLIRFWFLVSGFWQGCARNPHNGENLNFLL